MSRGIMGVLAGIGVLIALGLVLSHSGDTKTVVGAAFSGLDATIMDLERMPQHGTHA